MCGPPLLSLLHLIHLWWGRVALLHVEMWLLPLNGVLQSACLTIEPQLGADALSVLPPHAFLAFCLFGLPQVKLRVEPLAFFGNAMRIDCLLLKLLYEASQIVVLNGLQLLHPT